MSHDIDVDEVTKVSNASVTSYDIGPISNTIASEALVASHEVVPKHITESSEALIVSHDVVLKHFTKTITIDVPTFEVSLNHVPMRLCLSTSPAVESEGARLEDRSQALPNGGDNDSHDHSDGTRDANGDRASESTGNGGSPSENSGDEDTRSEEDVNQELLDDLKAVRTIDELNEVIDKWQARANWIAFSDGDLNITEQPLVHIMIREGSWCRPGLFPC